MMSSTELVPSYFGPAERQLFGCYNGPRQTQRRSFAVVICPPLGHEYVNSHRALRQLAIRLSNLGFPVLRFDYFGCGDSQGNSTECRTAQCIEDISQAIQEVRRRAGRQNTCLVGLRLGATLSLLTAAERSDVPSVVLWDPVLKGKDHLEEMMALNKELLRFRPKPPKRPDWPKDIIGFPVGRALYEDIDRIDLLAMRGNRSRNAFVIDTREDSSVGGLGSLLESLGVSVALERIDAPQIWIPAVNGGLKVPMGVLQSVESWLDRTCL